MNECKTFDIIKWIRYKTKDHKMNGNEKWDKSYSTK